jgi:hypothetical protein
LMIPRWPGTAATGHGAGSKIINIGKHHLCAVAPASNPTTGAVGV